VRHSRPTDSQTDCNPSAAASSSFNCLLLRRICIRYDTLNERATAQASLTAAPCRPSVTDQTGSLLLRAFRLHLRVSSTPTFYPNIDNKLPLCCPTTAVLVAREALSFIVGNHFRPVKSKLIALATVVACQPASQPAEPRVDPILDDLSQTFLLDADIQARA
jgi:hypothetical protein